MCELCFYPLTVVKNKPPRKASECSRSFWILDTTRLTRQKRRRRRKGRYLIFSQNLFLAAVHNGMQWNHLLHSSAQFDFGHVFSSPIYGTLKNVSLQLFFFSSLLGNRKTLQGKRCGECGECGNSCTLLLLRTVDYCCCCLHTGIVMEATEFCLWAVLASYFKDL